MRALGATRPVSEPVPIFPRRRTTFEWPAGYGIAWADAGTTALAIASRVVVERSGIDAPALVLPGYTCPSVVSAVFWAGARPVLIDTQRGSPWLDEAALMQHYDSSWVGVIVPHFLGLRHPMEKLESWCRERRLALIEDSAQLGPVSPAFAPSADLVVLSFGRGKPIPAGGGALLFRQWFEPEVLAAMEELPIAGRFSGSWRLRALAHAIAVSRLGYRIAKMLPGLHVGETQYRTLESPRCLGDAHARLVELVLAGWMDRSEATRQAVSTIVTRSSLQNLPATLGWDERQPLLRFPALAESATVRDRLYVNGMRMNLGISRLYETDLPGIAGMPELEVPGALTNASDFASRLLTLPIHSGVSRFELQKLARMLAEVHS